MCVCCVMYCSRMTKSFQTFSNSGRQSSREIAIMSREKLCGESSHPAANSGDNAAVGGSFCVRCSTDSVNSGTVARFHPSHVCMYVCVCMHVYVSCSCLFLWTHSMNWQASVLANKARGFSLTMCFSTPTPNVWV